MDDFSNDVSTTGSLVVGGDATEARFDSDGDIDWFRVELDQWTWYEFLVTPEPPGTRIDYELRFYDSEGVEFEGYLSDNKAERIFAHESGTWFVGVEYKQAHSGVRPYSISAALASANPGQTEIDVLTNTGYFSGTVAPGDSDVFEFDFATDATYYIDVLGNDTLGDRTLVDPLLEVNASSDGSQVVFDNDSGNGRDAYGVFMGAGLFNESYRLTVSGNEGAFGSYLLRLRASDDHPTGTTASTIVRTDVRTGYNPFQTDGIMELASDIDWYRLPMVKGQLATFEMSGSIMIWGISDGQSPEWLTGTVPSYSRRILFAAPETRDYFFVARNPIGSQQAISKHQIYSQGHEPLKVSNYLYNRFRPQFAAGDLNEENQSTIIDDLINGVQIYSPYDDFQMNGETYAARQIHQINGGHLRYIDLPVGERSVFVRKVVNDNPVSNWAEHSQYIGARDVAAGYDAEIDPSNPNAPYFLKRNFTYAFADSRPGYLDGKPWGNGFQKLSIAQQETMRSAIVEWGGPLDISFTELFTNDPADVDVLIYFTDQDANTWFLNPESDGPEKYDIALNGLQAGYTNPVAGSRAFFEMIASVGKMLGGKDNPQLNREYSVFGTRYTDDIQHELFPSTPSAYDLNRAQYKLPEQNFRGSVNAYYGTRTNFNNGFDNYELSGDPFVRTISDFFAENDQVDASQQGQRATIDLRAGRASFTGEWTDRTHTFFNGFNSSLIRGAGGPMNDFLSGNQAANRLWGLNGDDYLIGRAGDDYLSGGQGNDYFAYRDGDGSDIIDELNSGGYDILSIWGVDNFDNMAEDLKFHRENDDMVVSLNFDSMFSEEIDTIRINNFGLVGSRIESLQLSNMDGDWGWVSMNSIWAQINDSPSSFRITANSDSTGSLVARV